MSEPHAPTIVVVGGVGGGAGAATRARRCNEHANIILFEKDGYVSFANCGLPYYLGGEISERESLLVAKPELLRQRYNLDVRTRHEVTAIDRAAKTVTVQNHETGETLTQAYDKLILAPGAAPIVPPIEGVDAKNVFTLRNIEDTDAIACSLTSDTKHAVVVGAGYIGLEMVEQLQLHGIKVALVERMDQVLPIMDAEMTTPIRETLEQQLIDVHLSDEVTGFEVADGWVKSVTLKSGATLAADIVILGIGVRPQTQLAEAAGLSIGQTGGIAVNEYSQTEDPDIYAVGDVVEYCHGVLGEPMRIPLAGPANRAGRLAGEHAATGQSPPMQPVLGTAIVRVFDLGAATTGLTEKLAARYGVEARAAYIVANHHAGYYPGAKPLRVKLVYAPGDGKVLGAQVVGAEGADKRIDVIATAIHFGATVWDLGGLDLAYAPPYGSAKDPVHVAAFVAQNDLRKAAPLAGIHEPLEEVQLVDVRSAAEIARMCHANANCIPIDELRARKGELDPGKPTVVTCHSGLRAHIGARILQCCGFENVRNLTGGMLFQKLAGRVQTKED